MTPPFALIAPQKNGSVPWGREVADVLVNMPAVTRVPTGGWRGSLGRYGAILSHTQEPFAGPGAVAGYG